MLTNVRSGYLNAYYVILSICRPFQKGNLKENCNFGFWNEDILKLFSGKSIQN